MNNIEKGLALHNLYDGEAKCRIESEGILPDYCPDIKRVIKVDALPRIISKRAYFEGSNILCETEGSVAFNLLYLGGEGDTISSYTFYNDFEHSFKLPASQNEEYDMLSAICRAYSENINCKPQSPRKISLRCDVNLCMSLKANRAYTYYSPDEDIALGNVEIKKNKADVCMISSLSEREFSLSDSIKLPSEYPAVDEIVDFEARIVSDGAKIVSDGISFRATAFVCLAYRAEGDGKYISLCQPVELSDSIESDGIGLDENMQVNLRLTADTLNFDTELDDDGEAKIIKFDMSYSALALVMKNNTVSLVSDAYGINRDITYEGTDADFYSLVSSLHDTYSVHEAVDIKADTAESVRARADHRSFVIEDGKLYSQSKLYLSMLCPQKAGLDSQRKNIDIKIPISMTSEMLSEYERGNIRVDLFCDVKSVDCKKGDSGMQVTAQISHDVFIFAKPALNYITSLQIADTENVRNEMILYYPDSEDTLWSIGKKYKVSCEYIKAQNGMTDDELPEIIKI